ncbi:MAG: proC [Candidatus Midichloriaceae bacterium]|jgi:pyrroline-5-carboxylate reductase|nr:proC [Candidatus Midichloriaceae bacterium]
MKILFVGCGNMGSAIAGSMLHSKLFTTDDISVVLPIDSPHRKLVSSELGLKIFEQYPADGTFDAILFAIKPQAMSEVLPIYQNSLLAKSNALSGQKPLIISIAAGKSIRFLQKFFPGFPIVRVMPNINIIAEKGAAAAVANNETTTEQLKLVENIFAKSGFFTWLEDEKLIDVVVATSGSSPAYYFLFTELLAQIAAEEGLPKDIALRLAEESFIGSAFTKEKSSFELAQLRAMVTSEKGTTQAALSEFANDASLYRVMKAAFTAAVKRSQELSE